LAGKSVRVLLRSQKGPRNFCHYNWVQTACAFHETKSDKFIHGFKKDEEVKRLAKVSCRLSKKNSRQGPSERSLKKSLYSDSKRTQVRKRGKENAIKILKGPHIRGRNPGQRSRGGAQGAKHLTENTQLSGGVSVVSDDKKTCAKRKKKLADTFFPNENGDIGASICSGSP